MFRYYECALKNDLFLLIHCGYDIAFPGNVDARPSGLKTVKKEFPELKIIAAHFGGWQLWDEAIEYLLNSDIYFDTSFIHEMSDIQINALAHHPSERLLFGSDSPWLIQAHQIESIKSTFPDPLSQERIFFKNAMSLLKKSYSN